MEIESWTQICTADKQYPVPRLQQINMEHSFSSALDEPNVKSSRSVKSSLVLIKAKTVDCRPAYELGARYFTWIHLPLSGFQYKIHLTGNTDYPSELPTGKCLRFYGSPELFGMSGKVLQ